jgi:hypothetical protein
LTKPPGILGLATNLCEGSMERQEEDLAKPSYRDRSADLTLKRQTAQAAYSDEVQQPRRTKPTGPDPHRPADLRQRPPATFLPLDGKEKVYG